jgi:hypothetical protein
VLLPPFLAQLSCENPAEGATACLPGWQPGMPGCECNDCVNPAAATGLGLASVSSSDSSAHFSCGSLKVDRCRGLRLCRQLPVGGGQPRQSTRASDGGLAERLLGVWGVQGQAPQACLGSAVAC